MAAIPDQLKKVTVKPRFGNGGGGLLVDNPGNYTIFDPHGNQLEQVNAQHRGEGGVIKVQSHSVASGLPQNSYIIGPDGVKHILSGGAGQRHEFNEGQSQPSLVSNKGAVGGGGGGGSSSGGSNPSFDTGGPQTNVLNVNGQPTVIPGGANFGAVQFHPVDYSQSIADAHAAGDEAKAQYFQNLKDSQHSALDLVGTDIAGIKMGANELGPLNRAEGAKDTQANISRAGTIDQFNQSRLPGINNFNRGEISKTNDFNASQFENAVESSGIDYRKRINDVLDELGTESTGKFGDPILDSLSESMTRGRGSDVASAAGINPLSGAGINIQDKMSAKERIGMAFRAQDMIPGVAGQAQQLLQPPLELAKTQQETPTGVPLNTSNVADRLPVQANISAGSTALHIADTAQSYQAIPAPLAFQESIGVQKFNSQEQLSRDEFVASAQQGQIVGQANALQGGFNAATAADIRNQQNDQFQQGLSTANTNQGISALGQVGAAAVGAYASQPAAATPGSAGTVGAGNQSIGGPSVGGTAATTADAGAAGGGEAIGSVGSQPIYNSSGIAAPSGDSSSTIDPVTGASSGSVQDNSGFNIPSDTPSVEPYGGDSSGGSSFGGGEFFKSSAQLSGPPGLNGGSPSGVASPAASPTTYLPPSFDSAGGFTPVSGSSSDIGSSQFKSAEPLQVGGTQLTSGDYHSTMKSTDDFMNSSSVTPKPAAPISSNAGTGDSGKSFLPAKPGQPSESGLSGAYSSVTSAGKDLGIDAAALKTGINVLGNWASLTSVQKLAAAGDFGIQVLQNKGIFSAEDAKVIGAVGQALAGIADTKTAAPTRAGALGILTSNLATRSFVGSVNRPTSVNGQAVVGSVKMADGSSAFRLTDGTTVPQPFLQAGVDTRASLSAYQVLMGNAPPEKKMAALGAIGIPAAMADKLTSHVSDGNTLAALSVFNTAVPWEHQTEVQKAAAVMQISGTIQGATAHALPSNAQDKSRTGNAVLRGFGVSGSPSYSSSVDGVPFSVDSSGVNVHGSVAGHDVSVNPLTTGQTIDFYGVKIPLNSAAMNATNTPTFGGQSGGSGVSVGPRGASAHTTASVNGQTHVSVSGGVGLTGGAGVTPTIQFGNTPGAHSGAQLGGQTGGAAGSAFGPAGTAVGSFLGSAFGSALGSKFFGSTSSKQIRDGYRNNLVNYGIAEKGSKGEVNVKLADGSNYNLGQDGGAQLKNSDGTSRFSYEVDWTNPTAADSIPAAHIVEIATGLDPSMTQKDSFNRIAGQMTNAISSNAKNVEDAYKNAKSILDTKQISAESVGLRLEGLRVTNKISEQEYGVYLNQLNKIYGTSYKPQDRDQSKAAFIQMLGSNKNMSKADKQFYETLSDDKALNDNLRRTNDRIANIKKGANGGLPTPDRYQGNTIGTPKDSFNIQQAI